MRRLALSVLAAAIACAAFAGQNTWTESSPGPTYVPRIYGDRGDAGTAYASTPIGFYRTRDGGATWRSISAGLPPGNIAAFLVGFDSSIYVAIDRAIFVSHDRGDHWSGNILPTDIGPVIHDLADNHGLYVATDAAITYISDDGGWIDAKLPDGTGPIVSLTVSADAMYATTAVSVPVAGRPATLAGTLRSDDGGRTWTKISDSDTRLYASGDAAPVYMILNGAVYVSADRAKSWAAMPALPDSGHVESMTFGGADPYVATAGGVFVFKGSSWSRVGDAIPAHDVATSASSIYAAAGFGVLQLDGGTGRWSAGRGLPGAESQQIAIADSDPSVRYARANGSLWRTEDSGGSWSKIDVQYGFVRFVVSPVSAKTVYLPSALGPYPHDEIAKTTDGGITWNQISDRGANVLAIAPSNPTTLYGAFQDRMAKSTDGGATWGLFEHLPDSYYYGYGYGYGTTAIEVDPKDESHAFAASNGGLYQTRDGGETWDRASTLIFTSLIMDRLDPSRLYGLTYRGVLLRSTDSGTTWSSDELTDRRFASIAAGGSRVCAESVEAVYCRENGGSWTALVDGYQPTPLNHIAIDASGRHLASATEAGIWSYDIAGDDIRPQLLDNDVSRLARALDAHSGVVIPVAGTARGIGALYTTELAITNSSSSSQRVTAVWLPAGNGVAQTFQFDVGSGSSRMFDAGSRFGIEGIGTLALFAADPGVAIGASARVWSHPDDGRAPLAEDIPAASDLAPRTTAAAAGLRHDAKTRTNVGIVNLSPDAHGYIAQISGERKSSVVTLTVPAYSLVQVAIPDGDYGALSITVSADAESRWLFYGSSIDRSTGEAHMALGH